MCKYLIRFNLNVPTHGFLPEQQHCCGADTTGICWQVVRVACEGLLGLLPSKVAHGVGAVGVGGGGVVVGTGGPKAGGGAWARA